MSDNGTAIGAKKLQTLLILMLVFPRIGIAYSQKHRTLAMAATDLVLEVLWNASKTTRKL
jgi:hypothetical protein